MLFANTCTLKLILSSVSALRFVPGKKQPGVGAQIPGVSSEDSAWVMCSAGDMLPQASSAVGRKPIVRLSYISDWNVRVWP